jgi:polar amino acid transport system substrate-binding protein
MGTSSRRLIAASAAALLALTAAAPAFAQDADYLQRIKDAGVIRMSTDGLYPPQSELTPDGNYQGFDIDVGTEIADRLGVDIDFVEPAWELITAGNWGDRWDMSVGSMTITSPRQEKLDFTQPYYYTPAQMAANSELGIETLDDLAGKTICMGAATTYLDWMNGTLDFGSESPDTVPPEGSVATTFPTDRECAQVWGAGRKDFEGWLTSSVTVQDAIDDGLPVVAIGEPVFYEPLAVAFDKSVEDNDSLVEAVDAIIGEMHADGTLTELSNKWYGYDLTQRVDAAGDSAAPEESEGAAPEESEE